MRPDMCKVFVERARYGSRLSRRKKHMKKGYRKYVSRELCRDNLPNNEPMLGAWKRKDKVLNEHLGPLKRFLRAQIGRPWNLVHRDLCEHISFANAVQSHVLDHIHWFVAEAVEIQGRQIIPQARLHRPTLSTGDMYVCPVTGILKAAKDPRERFEPTAIRVNCQQWYLRSSDDWWEVRLQEWKQNMAFTSAPNSVKNGRNPEPFDIWCNCLVSDRRTREFPYPVSQYAVSKRGLTANEVKTMRKRFGSAKHLARDLHNWSGGREYTKVQEVQAGKTKICMREHGRPIGY